jgi:hypothetical protein
MIKKRLFNPGGQMSVNIRDCAGDDIFIAGYGVARQDDFFVIVKIRFYTSISLQFLKILSSFDYQNKNIQTT